MELESTNSAPASEQELILGKYKSTDDLAKAYKELERKLGAFVGAPEEYTIPESVKNKELAEIFARKGKELNMSQHAYEQLLSEYENTSESKRKAFKESVEKLDGEQKRTFTEVVTFLQNNLSEADAKRVNSLINSMDDVKIFDQLRRAKTLTNVQAPLLTNETKPQTLEDYLKTVDRSRLYGAKPDINYRNEVQANIKRFSGDE